MRLSDIAGLVASHGAERFMRKRASVVLPLAVGAMLPGIAQRAAERASSTEKAMNQASGAKVAALPLWFALPLAQAMSSSGPVGRGAGALGEFAGNVGAPTTSFVVDDSEEAHEIRKIVRLRANACHFSVISARFLRAF